ncbi:MAG: NADH-quinone oxidoreductase subunit NuoE [Planctomycetota bacterium]
MSPGIPVPNATNHAAAAKNPRAYFTKETIAKFDAQAAQYPSSRAALIPILHYAQDEKGWLSHETLEMVALFLNLAPIHVWEVVTFYPMFHLKPAGKHVVWVCRNISCDLRGCQDLIQTIETKYKIKPGETTPDGKLTFKLAECLGGCAQAPVADLDGEYHENLTPAQLEKLLGELK